MKPIPLCDKLNELLYEGLAAGVFLAVETHTLAGPPHTTELSPTHRLGMLEDGGISAAGYIELLKNNQYSAVFANGAILSIECTFDERKLVAHRYTYIPYLFEKSTLTIAPEEVGLAEWLEGCIVPESAIYLRSCGTLRFDCTREPIESATDPHPISHLTFGSPDCRIPVKSPMSISGFLNFIFDNFQRQDRDFWLDYSSFLSCEGTDSTIRESELILHHINWSDTI